MPIKLETIVSAQKIKMTGSEIFTLFCRLVITLRPMWQYLKTFGAVTFDVTVITTIMTGATLILAVIALTTFGFKTKLVVCIGFGLATIVAVILAAYRAAHRERVRQDLASFMPRGLVLYERCFNKHEPPPSAEGEEWLKELSTFVHSHISPASALTLKMHLGLPGLYLSGQMDPERSKLIVELQTGLIRLTEILGKV